MFIPCTKAQGVFELPVTFSAGGEYKLYADFLPKGMNELTRMGEVEVRGEAAAPSILKPSERLVARVDGMKVELAFAEEPCAADAAEHDLYVYGREDGGADRGFGALPRRGWACRRD